MNIINDVFQECGLYLLLILPFLYFKFLKCKTRNQMRDQKNGNTKPKN